MLAILQNREESPPGADSAGVRLRKGSSNLTEMVKIMHCPSCQ